MRTASACLANVCGDNAAKTPFGLLEKLNVLVTRPAVLVLSAVFNVPKLGRSFQIVGHHRDQQKFQ